MVGMSSKALIKVGLKLIISRLPIARPVLNRMGIFRHGGMAGRKYAEKVFQQHFAKIPSVRGLRILELGPGDSLACGVLAVLGGAKESIHIDSGPYASIDASEYVKEYPELLSRVTSGITLQKLSEINIRYFTDGIESFKKIPSESIDFCFSNAVLEHIPLDHADQLVRELRRILKPGATMSHQIDFKDHIDSSLNNLCVSRSLWEKKWFAQKSGFYTNRYRLSDWIRMFESNGFFVDHVTKQNWNVVPRPRTKLSSEFQKYTDEDLCCSSAHIQTSLTFPKN
jgi:SAM-dependent methyltransferase